FRWFPFRWRISLQITIPGLPAALTFVIPAVPLFEIGRKTEHQGEKRINTLKIDIIICKKVNKGQDNALMQGARRAILKSRKVKVKPGEFSLEVVDDVWPDTVQKAEQLAGRARRLESVGRGEPGVRGIVQRRLAGAVLPAGWRDARGHPGNGQG